MARLVGPFLGAELGELMDSWQPSEYYSDSSDASIVPPKAAAPTNEGAQPSQPIARADTTSQRSYRQPHRGAAAAGTSAEPQRAASSASSTHGAAPAAGTSVATQRAASSAVIDIRGEGKRKASPAHKTPDTGARSSTAAAAASAVLHHEHGSDACSDSHTWVGTVFGSFVVTYDPEIAPHCGYACMLHLAGQSINMPQVQSLRSHVHSVLSEAASRSALVQGRSLVALKHLK
eukprot:552198-Amphidinium_carterae.2